MSTHEINTSTVYVDGVRIWTPSGERVWAGYIHEGKILPNGSPMGYTQFETIKFAQDAYGFIPSSGLWHQVREKLKAGNPNVESSFITNDLEDTSTVLKFLKNNGNYAHGVIVQYPLINEEGTNFERDEKEIPL